MTLVRNRQRQLSGNRFWTLLAIVFALGLQSCSGGIFKKKTPKDPDPQITYPEKDVVEQPVEKDDTVIVPVDTIKQPAPVEILEEVDIAIMLPFKLDALDQGRGFDSASKNSFELYKGMTTALGEADIERLKLNIHVLDNAGTILGTNRLLERDPFPDVDVVIGPLYVKNVQTIAPFAQSRKIPIVSPLASSLGLASANPYVYTAVADDKTRYKEALRFMQKEFSNPNIGIIYQPVQKEIKTKESMLAAATALNLTVQEQVSEGREMFSSVSNLLVKDRPNVVFVAADDNEEGKIYIDGLLSYLEFIASDYDINIVGMSEWSKISSLSSLKLAAVNTYSIEKYFVDSRSNESSQKLNFLRGKNNNQKPHTYFIQGYDLMSFVVSLIDKHGEDFMDHFDDTRHVGLQTTYDFQTKSMDQYNVNQYINIVKYEGGGWNKANR